MARLRLFANLREAAGAAEVEVPGSSVGEVLAEAGRRFGARFTGGLSSAQVWVNGHQAGEETPVGDGDVDWKGQLRELLTSHYEGYASLETHWRPKALPENSLSQPGGEGVSEAGEYASDLCLKNLMRVLGEARREAG